MPAPMLVSEAPVDAWVVPAGTGAGNFVARGVARRPASPAEKGDVSLTPFHRTHRRRYSVYFDVLSDADFADRVATYSAERERLKRLEAATVSSIQPGDQAAENGYNYRSDPSDRRTERTAGRQSRGGPGWFSYDLPVEALDDVALVVTYFNDLGLPPTAGNFEIKVEGTTIATFEPNTRASGFYDARYAIPRTLVGGKARVTVRFEATGAGRIAPVFGVRVVRLRDL